VLGGDLRLAGSYRDASKRLAAGFARMSLKPTSPGVPRRSLRGTPLGHAGMLVARNARVTARWRAARPTERWRSA
jgi:hypothetical protein